MATGKLLRRLKTRPSTAYVPLAFSPDGKTVVVQRRPDAASLGDRHGQGSCGPRTSHNPRPRFAYSADGKTLIWAGYQRRLHLCDAATGKELRSWDDEKKRPISALACSPDGRVFAAYGSRAEAEGLARLWDAATGKEVWHLEERGEASITAAAFSPDGKILATGSQSRADPLMGCGHGQGIAPLRRLAGAPAVWRLRRMARHWPRGAAAEVGSSPDQTVHLWDVALRPERFAALATAIEGTVCSAGLYAGRQGHCLRQLGRLRSPVGCGHGRATTATPAGRRRAFLRRAGSPASPARFPPTARPLSRPPLSRIETKSSVKVRRWDRETARELPGWSQKSGPRRLIRWSFLPTARPWPACDRAHSQPGVSLGGGDGQGTRPHRRGLSGVFPGRQAVGHRSLRGRNRMGRDRSPSGRRPRPRNSAPSRCRRGAVYRLLFSPDGRMLATMSNVGLAVGRKRDIHLLAAVCGRVPQVRRASSVLPAC